MKFLSTLPLVLGNKVHNNNYFVLQDGSVDSGRSHGSCQGENSGPSVEKEQPPRLSENAHQGEKEQSKNKNKKRLKPTVPPDDITAEALICMKSISEAVTKRDSSSIFAEFVADSLRNSNRPTFEVNFAKQKITQILFDLQNGEYADHRIRTTTSSSASRSSSSVVPPTQPDYYYRQPETVNSYDSQQNERNSPQTPYTLQNYLNSFTDNEN